MNRNDVDVTILEKTFSGGNAADRVEMFRDLALGMFIHWSCDSLLGSEISHPLVGASERILRQYHEFFPSHFNPRRFDPEDYAELADAVGMNYFCFTAKHHSGFCMFDTKTTRFNVKNSSYGRDVKREFIEFLKKDGDKSDVAVDVLMVAKYLERIADHAVNVCEWTEFSDTGAVGYVMIL